MDQEIRIVDYENRYREDFVRLSVSWISEHWPIEERDRYELGHVKENIIDKGGFILMALMGDTPVGTIAMIAMDGEMYDYELAKFTSSREVRGRGIGRKLMAVALRRADANVRGRRDFARVYIETNHLCEAGIHLYEQFGFKVIPGKVSEVFERGDVLMERV